MPRLFRPLHLLLLSSLALVATGAHAEKLAPPQIEVLRANFSQGCHTTTKIITPSWLQAGEAEQICSCADAKTASRLAEADFADIGNLTKADQMRIDDLGTKAADECLQPFFAKGVARMAARQCVENAATIPHLQSLAPDRVPQTCACAGEHYVQSADLRDIDQVAGPDGMVMKHIGDLLKPYLAACTAH